MPPRRPRKPAAARRAANTLAAGTGAVRQIAPPHIVTVAGVTGLFTPMTNALDTPLTDDERKNFQAVIAQLTKEAATLRDANAALTKQLDELRNPPSSHDDFAAAIQQSVDGLQQKLSTMKNPVSSFALKEFRVEATVMVGVSPLGAIEYRFVRPGDSVDPNAVSRITLNLVPIPKSGPDHSWTADLFQPDLAIDQVPQITGEQARLLEANQIFTIGDFLQVGTRARATAELAALLRVERAALATWLDQAQLLTIKGINGATVLVLIAAGFTSLDAIAGSNPDGLLKAYLETRKKLRNAQAIEATLDDVTRWITAARRYSGLKSPA